MDWSSIPDKLLPGAWPKWILAMTVALSAILYGFFPDIPSEYLPNSNKEKFLLRLLISGTSLLLGSIVLIFSLVRELNKKSILDEENTNLKLKISEHQKTIATLSKTAYDVLKHNEPPSLIPKFGILWDKNKEAYCPISDCKTLLSRYTEEPRESGGFRYYFICPKCERPRYLQNGNTPITLEEALKML